MYKKCTFQMFIFWNGKFLHISPCKHCTSSVIQEGLMYVEPDLDPDLHLLVLRFYEADINSSCFTPSGGMCFGLNMFMHSVSMDTGAWEVHETRGEQTSPLPPKRWHTMNCTAGMLVASNLMLLKQHNWCHQQQQPVKEGYSKPDLIYYCVMFYYFLPLCFKTFASVEGSLFFI